MPIPTYTLGYPPDGSSLGQTKSTIRNNLDGTFETLAVDHIDNNGQPGGNPAGYHKIIHEVAQTGAAPNLITPIGGVNQVFSGVPGTLVVNAVTTPTIPPGGDTQLYSLSGAGVLSQLTGRVTGGDSSNGYAWVGGILVQWGKVSNPGQSASGSVLFTTANIDFPNFCFNVSLTPTILGAAITILNLVQNSITKTGFSWKFSNFGTDFYWIAIGN